MNNEVHKRFGELFKRVMKVDDVRDDYAMGTLVQWDSLKHVELLTEIDEVFQIEIDPTHLWKMTSVQGILDVLSEYLN